MNLWNKPSWVNKINELWIVVIGLLSIFLFIEVLHVDYHEKGKAWLEAPQCRTSD